MALKAFPPGTPTLRAQEPGTVGGLTELTAAQLRQVAGGGVLLTERVLPMPRAIIGGDEATSPGVILSE